MQFLRYMEDLITQPKPEITEPEQETGAIGYILAWLIGIPIPILLAVFLIRGCD